MAVRELMELGGVEEMAGDWLVQWKQEGACLCCAPAS